MCSFVDSFVITDDFTVSNDNRMQAFERSISLLQSKSNYIQNAQYPFVDLTTAEPIVHPLADAIQKGANVFTPEHLRNYTTAQNMYDLRTTIIKYLHETDIKNINDKNIVLGSSVFSILCELFTCKAFCWNKDCDTILADVPLFGHYIELFKRMKIKMTFLTSKKEHGYRIDPNMLDIAIQTHRPRIFLFQNPVNPTGVVYTKEDMEKIATVLQKYPILVVCDEIFKHCSINTSVKDFSIGGIYGMDERTITLRGFSKTFNIPGLRISYACMPSTLVQIMNDPLCGFSYPEVITAKEMLITAIKDNLLLYKYAPMYIQELSVIKDIIKKRNTSNPESVILHIEPCATNVVLIGFIGACGTKYKDLHINNSNDFAYFLKHIVGIDLPSGEAYFIDGKYMVMRIPLYFSNKNDVFNRIFNAMDKLLLPF